MNVRPINRYSQPRIPTRAILDDHPELLRLVPKRWQGNPVVLTALAGVCALSGCRGPVARGTPPSSVSRAAPIFQHGTGRGTFAGKTMCPPVALSEDDAKQIIVEEAKKARVIFTEPGAAINGVPVETGCNEKRMLRKVKLELDGIDRRRSISYEYISEPDVRSVNTSKLWPWGTAQIVRDGLIKRKPEGTYAVFYDPSSHAPMIRDESGGVNTEDYFKRAQKISHEELRKQVQDFIKWLKAQGVI